MALSPEARLARTYAGPIAAAVSQRASTSEIWDAIRAAAASVGEGAPLPSLAAVNELRSLYASSRNAAEALDSARSTEERTGLGQSITGTMVSTGFRSRDTQALQTAADYLVRFERQYVDPFGKTGTQWITTRYSAGTLPPTVGELIDALSSFTPSVGTPTVGNLTGIGSVNIEAV